MFKRQELLSTKQHEEEHETKLFILGLFVFFRG